MYFHKSHQTCFSVQQLSAMSQNKYKCTEVKIFCHHNIIALFRSLQNMEEQCKILTNVWPEIQWCSFLNIQSVVFEVDTTQEARHETPGLTISYRLQYTTYHAGTTH